MDEKDRRQSLSLVIWLFFLAIVLASCTLALADPAPHPQVLILNSYHPGFPWSDDEMAGVKARLRQDHPNMEPYIEYLDEKHFPGKDHMVIMKDHIKVKYHCKRIDLLIVLDNPALDLALRYRDEIFPRVPIVFAGINDFKPELLAGHDRVTGVAENPDIAGTMELALALHPDTSEVLVIHDYTATGMTVRSQFEKLLPEFNGRVNVSFVPEFTFEELVGQVRTLPPHTLGVIIAFTTDRTVRSLSAADAVHLIAYNTDAPMYAMHEIRLGHGIVGGMLLNGKDHGRLAGNIASRVLAGEDVSAIPVHMESTSRPMFDYNQLKRFHISLRNLPEGNTIINMPESFYFRHKSLVLGTLAVLAFLLTALIGLSLDIARRKRVEEALRRSEEKFSRAFHHAPLLMTLSRIEDGTYIEVNEKFVEISGFDRQQALGRTSVELGWISKKDRHRLIEELKGKGCVEEMELTLTARDNRKIHCIYNGQLIATNEGQRLLSIAVDVTLRKLAEEARRESEERYQTLFRNDNIVMLVVDPQTAAIVDANPAAVSFYGYGREDLLRLKASDINTLPPERIKAVIELVQNKEQNYFEFQHRLANGEVRDVIVYSGPISIGGRQLLFSIVHDDTERKMAQEENRRLEAQLRQAQKMEAIGTLAGGIAHDFNNILAAILGFTEMALDDIPEGSSARYDLEEVLKATYRARDLVKQILVFSRQKDSPEKQPIEIAPIVKEALKLLRAALPTTIEIRQDISDGSGAVLGDPTQIHQVIMNLCTNAAYAMQDHGGLLEVALSDVEVTADMVNLYPHLKPGAYLKLIVKDCGMGMDAAIMERIFDPYFTTKSVGEGSGLGLAVVQGIVKRHEGAITVESQPGKGTLFNIFLPKIESAHEHEESGAGSIPRGEERVLFVDDEAPLTAVAKKMLGQLGYQVTTRTNALDALELFRTQPDAFDLVITDHNMPYMTGVDLAMEMLRIRPDTPIVLCTGFNETISEERARELGIRTFVMKPIGRHSLAEVIRSILDGKEAR